MTRLPPALQPLWPAAKVVHRAATRSVGRATRSTGVGGDRAVPRTALPDSRATTAAEPDHVRIHVGAPAQALQRPAAEGGPVPLTVWDEASSVEVPERFVLAVDHGRLIGDYAATVTPGGILDLQTSPYFGIRGWHEHPIYLRSRLPETTHLPGTTASLASPASTRNYYHSLMDALPRWAVLTEALPDARPDHVVVSHRTRWDAQLASLVGLDRFHLVEPEKHLAVDTDRLLVPSLNNVRNLAPRWITDWLRRTLPPRDVTGRPRRLYVTRGSAPRSRRLVHEPDLCPQLERMGFTRFDPGAVTVQEQIDHFAAAEVVVGVHGAGLANLNFAPEGVRVLELFAPRYVDPGYWAITSNITDSTYRYLVADPAEPGRPQRRMNRVQDDVDLPADRVLGAVEELLAT
ncbi:glycosyltransferase family 61 protein [Aeromicrobium sp. CF4.19]|uniref:glycosyltransferase family 61 protein n=1 Tax=Aeromicrobium sp. CF4.19 TaxID=3373082 RepID=UPI003EE5D0E5